MRVLAIIILTAVLAVSPARASFEANAVRDLITLARSLTDYGQRDQMLQNGAQRFSEAQSFLAIAGAAVYDSTKNNVLSMGAARAQAIPDSLALATACPDYGVRDRLILAAQRLCREPGDFLTLASRAVYDSTKNALMQNGIPSARHAADFVALARSSPDYGVRDRILLAGAARVAGIEEFVTLYNAAVYDSTKVSLVQAAVRDARNVSDIVRVAKLSPKYDVRDQILLQGVRFCTSVSDAQFLAGAAVYDSTKNAILRDYARMAGFTALHGD